MSPFKTQDNSGLVERNSRSDVNVGDSQQFVGLFKAHKSPSTPS
jgi:hypothetical protein